MAQVFTPSREHHARADGLQDAPRTVPEDMVNVLAKEGFGECKRETTTSRRDGHPAGGVWQGVDPRTGSVASAVWVNHAKWPPALVFIEVDGESLTGGLGAHGEP